MTAPDYTDLCVQGEALSAMIHMGEKISFGQDTAMIDALIAAIRELDARVREAALDALAASGQAQDAYEAQLAAEAKLAEVEKERDGAWKIAHDATDRGMKAEAAVATLTAQVEAMRGALLNIDALDPDQNIYGFSTDALRGLVLRMGEIARVALTTENQTNG